MSRLTVMNHREHYEHEIVAAAGKPVGDGGDVVQRKTRKGRIFYGCANYPNCDFTSWKKPIAKPCPNCGGMLVIANKREAQCLNCQETFLLEEVVPESA